MYTCITFVIVLIVVVVSLPRHQQNDLLAKLLTTRNSAGLLIVMKQDFEAFQSPESSLHIFPIYICVSACTKYIKYTVNKNTSTEQHFAYSCE